MSHGLSKEEHIYGPCRYWVPYVVVMLEIV